MNREGIHVPSDDLNERAEGVARYKSDESAKNLWEFEASGVGPVHILQRKFYATQIF